MSGPQFTLNLIIIYAGDAGKCAAFYRDHLGLMPVGEWSREWAELQGGGCRLAFHQAYGPEGEITTPTGSPAHPHKVVFETPDLAEARRALLRQSVTVTEIEQVGPETEAFEGLDPEGHRFQIYARVREG